MRRVNCVVGLAAFAFAVSAWPQSAWPSYPNNSAIAVASDGSVGIGTASPAARLHAVGNVLREVARFQGSIDVTNNRNFFSLYTTNPGFWWEFSNQDPVGAGTTNGLAFRERSAADPSISRMYIAQGGNVGIGTINPQYLLSVNGVIGAKDVIVTNSGWSDYVFRPGYRLRPLSEVSAYIEDHGHLPEIPTEAEVKEKGVSVGEMQAKLLAKIEELTLHMIQQEKENRGLRERVGRLESGAASISDSAAITVR